MAKQNFLAGGFYGKLGATVGQRWKNKRTLRTYVIPENPKTPKQMANRNKFTAAVPFAQKGMAMNYHSPAFASEETTEWALRMSAAKYAIDLGQVDVAAIPIVPRNFVSAYTITGISIVSVTDTTHAKFLLAGDLPTGSKHYSLMIYFSNTSRAGEYMLCDGVTDANDNTDLTVTCENTQGLLNATLFGVIVSNDDIDAQTVTYSARVEIQQAAKPAFTTDWEFVSITKVSDGNYQIRMHCTESIMGFIGTKAVYCPQLDGTLTTKAATQTNGGESGAATTALDRGNFVFTFNSFDETNNDALLTANIRNVEDIQCFNNAALNIYMAWSNAYTPSTDISSGRTSTINVALPQYLQDEFNNAVTGKSLTPYYEQSYGAAEVALEYTFADNTFGAAVRAAYAAMAGDPDQHGSCSGSVVAEVEGSQGTYTLDGTIENLSWGASQGTPTNVDSELQLGVTALDDVEEWTLISLTVNLTVNIFQNGSTTKRFGVYDTSHRWTPVATETFSGTVTP